MREPELFITSPKPDPTQRTDGEAICHVAAQTPDLWLPALPRRCPPCAQRGPCSRLPAWEHMGPLPGEQCKQEKARVTLWGRGFLHPPHTCMHPHARARTHVPTRMQAHRGPCLHSSAKKLLRVGEMSTGVGVLLLLMISNAAFAGVGG